MVGEERSKWPLVPGYRLTGVIGSGNFGIVYDAVNDDDQVQVRRAIKVFRPGVLVDADRARARLSQEIAALAKLGQHPQVVQYVASSTTRGKHGQWPFVVMNFVEGESLRLRRGKVDAVHAAQVMGDVLVALEHCHTHGIIHRDIKPDNIVVSSIPVLVDFGLAHVIDDDAGAERLSRDAVGTGPYIPDETRRDFRMVGPGNDIYASGVCLYELIAGELPKMESYESVAKYSDRGADADLDEIVRSALAPLDRRYRSAAEFRLHLLRWIEKTRSRADRTQPEHLPHTDDWIDELVEGQRGAQTEQERERAERLNSVASVVRSVDPVWQKFHNWLESTVAAMSASGLECSEHKAWCFTIEDAVKRVMENPNEMNPVFDFRFGGSTYEQFIINCEMRYQRYTGDGFTTVPIVLVFRYHNVAWCPDNIRERHLRFLDDGTCVEPDGRQMTLAEVEDLTLAVIRDKRNWRQRLR